MTQLQRLVFTLILIFVSLALGYISRHLAAKYNINENRQLQIRKKLQTCAIFVLIPLSAMLSLWGLPLPDAELFGLPFLGLIAYIWGGFLAIALGKTLGLSRRQIGSYYCCGTFTNLGAVGGLVCLLFLGEASIALVALYRLLEEIYYFSVSFPIARKYSQNLNSDKQKTPVFNPVLYAVLLALGTGGLLNWLDIPRPPIFGYIASASMFLATVLFLYAIGLSLKLGSIAGYILPGLGMCFIKFAAVPVLLIFLAIICDYANFENGLALKVVAILSCMPVAMTALVPPTLFDLDVDLANACWIITTAGLVIVLPALIYFLPFLD